MADVDRDRHFTEEDLVWFFYGEADNAAEIDLHLTLCHQCRTEYESLKIAMNTISSWSEPEHASDYGQQVWRELVSRDASIGSRRGFRWAAWFTLPRVAAVALSACLVLIAFFAGRVAERLDPAQPVSSPLVRERLLAAALSDHIEDSERTLIEITNQGGESAVNIQNEQNRAESLLNANRLYRQAAQRQGRVALATVLEDLERVLLDIAHTSGELSPNEVERLRARIEDQELLFRLRVIGLRLRELQQQPARMQDKRNLKG